ncbi:MAG TPA: AI-2E family transporter, partial [Patescibacteria group bacterium]|nr:AI-2E family transporter [Patescibacteria group bacterium]
AKRRDIPLTILGWIVVAGMLFWLLSFVSGTVAIIIIAAFFAYALVPVVDFLAKFMPRILAILVTYSAVLLFISALVYLVISTAIGEFAFLATNLSHFLAVESSTRTPLHKTLQSFGITSSQITALENELTGQAEKLTSSIIPVLSSVVVFLIDMAVVAIISIYLLIDGAALRQRIEENTPSSQQHRLEFLLKSAQLIIGNYIRGQIILSVIIGLFVGIGMALFHVPYALLLGVIAGFLEFIPIIGTFISGAICILLALTQGWLTAVFVLIYFIIIHIIEGDILGPRIVGRAVGLHPLVSIIALIAGSELYGVIGALFAAPIAGLIQVIAIAAWTEWRSEHEDEFKKSRKRVAASLLSKK